MNNTKRRGFGSMDINKAKSIQSMGGKAAHKKGTGHEWTRDEALTASKKGVRVMKMRKEAKKQVNI